ncbi:3-hydroxyacyl-CoA dehydrogenase/enoyl-CoA hydratase family protein [Cesiribacter sp. SM1]|uniref:3-hydroxyacyl-CoA dehydrogenase/enoyl-CoA hydratase family protein n=1 Tax=Cesiribacter sp. SM1 TaxID=2861196 RepID=UPI001CD79BAC|nr:3-hydroxyacyl-CoA dehydrogenase/enoyl-CoA hydratase family protein [Cesiribacter sp. SM1]
MKRTINKVTVLGSGIMGSRIAAHFANIGVKVRLLDIAPFELTEDEQQKGLSLDDPRVKMRIVSQSWENTLKSKPASLYTPDFASRVELGNFKDNMKDIGDSDWVIEVVVENLKIKKQVFDDVEKYRRKGTLITSNTSGIPIHLMLDGRSDDFAQNFCGTHFFNPPRYLKLLEIIPTPKTNPEVVDFLMKYGSQYLGKTTVLAKDTPAFIANRVGIYAILKVVDTMQKLELNVDEVDRLTGPVIGRPKSATFRTSDVVGLDTLVKVANGLYHGLPNDEQREIFNLPPQVNDMVERKWLGDKTGQGFYKKTKNSKGQTEILTLDLNTMEYGEKQRPKFATLEQTKPIENLKERMPVLLSGKDKAGEFYRHSFYGLFQYSSNRIPEIADELYKIDDALKTGFGWKLGPFETWDILGVQKTVQKMEELGYQPNQWVYQMLESGNNSFYKTEGGRRLYYDIQSKEYKGIPGTEEFILLDTLRGSQKVWGNAEATVFDLGDGILNLEFHSKMNTMGAGVIEGINRAINLAEEKYRGLVIANEGDNFSAGANLGMLFMYAIEQEFDEVEFMVRQFQQTIMRARYSSVPVVVAPHGMTLGGGCELTMHADQVVAAAETYIGLVEVGVGLIPAGGGTKEFTLRVSDKLESGDVEYNALQNAFMNIATAKVATSAYEAMDMNIIRKKDRVVVNKDRQIAEAKAAALALAEAGYVQPIQRSNVKVQGRGGMALFLAGIHGMRAGNYISDHDQKIASKIAYVMCGGDLSYPQEVSEQYLLDLEREAFVSLCGERKTLERIQSIIQGGKPLRN